MVHASRDAPEDRPKGCSRQVPGLILPGLAWSVTAVRRDPDQLPPIKLALRYYREALTVAEELGEPQALFPC